MTQSSKSERAPLDGKLLTEMAGYFATLKQDERIKAMTVVKKRVEIADANAGDFKPPALLSTQEAKEERVLHVSQTHAAIVSLGYDHELHRLLGRETNSTECRGAVARQLQIDHGWADEYVVSLIQQVVTGRSGSLLETLDPCKPGKLSEYVFAVENLIFQGLLHSIVGPEGSNKTIMAIKWLCQLAEEKKHVMLLEYEIAAEPIGKIMEELGYDREELRPYFHSKKPCGPFTEEVLWEIRSEHPDLAALVLDSMAEAVLSGGDGDENASGDALAVLGPLSDFAHQQGTPVIVLGHPGYSDGTRERGSSARGPAVDVRYQIKARPGVTVDRKGHVGFICWKDRTAQVGLGSQRWFEIGSGAGDRKLPIKPMATPGEITDQLTEDGAAMIVKLGNYAQEHPENAWLTTRTALQVAGLTRTKRHTDELEALANDEESPIEMRVKPRGNAAQTTEFCYSERDDEDASVLPM
jgi:hypothetical protein